MKLNDYDGSKKVLSMMKTRQDNDITDRTSVVYAKIITKLSWLIKQDVVYYEKRGENNVTNHTGMIST